MGRSRNKLKGGTNGVQVATASANHLITWFVLTRRPRGTVTPNRRHRAQQLGHALVLLLHVVALGAPLRRIHVVQRMNAVIAPHALCPGLVRVKAQRTP
jgi:hypothetical protein